MSDSRGKTLPLTSAFDRFAELGDRVATLLACDYAKDAVLILPGSVAQGPDEIKAAFAGFFQAAGAINSVTVTSTTTQKRRDLDDLQSR